MHICITLLHGPANHSPLHSSSAVQFFVSLNLLAGSHFSSGTFVTVSPSNVPQNTLRVCTPDPHFAEHYGTKIIVCQMSRERTKYVGQNLFMKKNIINYILKSIILSDRKFIISNSVIIIFYLLSSVRQIYPALFILNLISFLIICLIITI